MPSRSALNVVSISAGSPEMRNSWTKIMCPTRSPAAMSMGSASDWSSCRKACHRSASAAERDSSVALSHNPIFGSISCCSSAITPGTPAWASGGTFTLHVPSIVVGSHQGRGQLFGRRHGPCRPRRCWYSTTVTPTPSPLPRSHPAPAPRPRPVPPVNEPAFSWHASFVRPPSASRGSLAPGRGVGRVLRPPRSRLIRADEPVPGGFGSSIGGEHGPVRGLCAPASPRLVAGLPHHLSFILGQQFIADAQGLGPCSAMSASTYSRVLASRRSRS